VTEDLFAQGRNAAILIWSDAPEASRIDDPRDERFASGVMAALTESTRGTPGIMRRVVDNAAAAAEDLNVEPFQGLVEVLQNADDLGARELRFALSEHSSGRRLLIVHDGAPVTCHHVLAMTLPYLTTKTGDAEQKGRFGIGLKTLRRISHQISIHSAPYHFTADGLELIEIPPAKSITGFYDPTSDTFLELDLVADFSDDALDEWFESWNEDGLLFLKSLRRFCWRDLDDDTERAKEVDPGPWEPLEASSDLAILSRRRVAGKLDDKGKRLLGEDRENLKAVFQVKKVFFVDGTVKTYGLRG
jgi:hypothetical protein